jgi:release factor glutamine methyltransferase
VIKAMAVTPPAGPSAAPPPGTAAATIGAALRDATASLRAAGVPAADLDALLLLAEVTGLGKAAVLAHPERTLASDEASRYAALVARRAGREPLAYVLGRREFYGRDFVVTPAVLVPRPETELLVELALEFLRDPHLADHWPMDIGTGSGALAVTLAAERGARLLATDRSAAALAVARANAARHGVAERVYLLCADLMEGIVGPLALVVANLPYIPTTTFNTLAPEVAAHEPRLALDGGPDGLALIWRLLDQARTRLTPGGVLLLEIGADQGGAVRAAAAQYLPGADVAVIQDLAGWDRVVRVQRR